MSDSAQYLTVAQVQERLGLGRSQAYELRKSERIERILGRPIEFQEKPLRYLAKDIEEVTAYFQSGGTRIICIINQKGGIGKTETVANLGVLLANSGLRVLAIDLDPQANLTTTLGAVSLSEDNPTELIDREFPRTISNVFSQEYSLAEVIQPTRVPNLDLVPADLGLAEAALGELPHDYLKESIKKDAASYRYVLIDTPPTLSDFTRLSLGVAQDVLVPLEASDHSIRGLIGINKSITLARMRNADLNVLGFFFTRVPGGSTILEPLRETVEKTGRRVFTSTIPYSQEVEKAHLMLMTIIEFNPSHPVTKAYSGLSQEIFDL